MQLAHEVLIRNLREHSQLDEDDVAQIATLAHTIREFDPDEDLIRQGDTPVAAALILSGMVGRYHLLSSGHRQYLSFHLAGDMPDAQGLFIDSMDHAVCSIGQSVITFISHRELIRAFRARPSLGFAIWRETLIDAAIFREAITNNSSRTMLARMAHLFCELFYRAQMSKLNRGGSLDLPLSLVQLGECLGMAIATVNRTLQQLRASGAMDLRDGELIVKNWPQLTKLAEFEPGYLHLKRHSPV